MIRDEVNRDNSRLRNGGDLCCLKKVEQVNDYTSCVTGVLLAVLYISHLNRFPLFLADRNTFNCLC